MCFNLHIDWNAVSEGEKKSILSKSTLGGIKLTILKNDAHFKALYVFERSQHRYNVRLALFKNEVSIKKHYECIP